MRFPVTWVAEFLYRPVFIGGLGLSQDESGLWWLITQRARNLALIDPVNRPPIYILKNVKDADIDFWRHKPMGVIPIECHDWNEGWDKMLEMASGEKFRWE